MDLELTSVRKAYGDVVALDGVTLAAGANETVAVVGPSGCGKSTLLELVCGLTAPDAGEVRSPPAALMPQRDGLLPWLSALDNAGLALGGSRASRARRRGRRRTRTSRRSGWRASSARGRRSSRAGCASAWPSCARCWPGAPVLCLDEPFGALDALTRGQMQRWLAGALAKEPRTVLLVTHDVEEAVLLADRIVLLSPRPGRVVETLEVVAAAPARADRPRGRGAARARAARAIEQR